MCYPRSTELTVKNQYILFTSGSFDSLGNLGRLTADIIEQGGLVSSIKKKRLMFELHSRVV